MAAVVCHQRDEGMRDDTHLGHCHTDVHTTCGGIAHMKRAPHDWKTP